MPPDHVIAAQNAVFAVARREKTMTPEEAFAFILVDSPLFRAFAEQHEFELAPKFEAIYNGDMHEVPEIRERYELFRSRIIERLERLDPDTYSALTEAIERSDIDGVRRILLQAAVLSKVEAV